MPSDEFMPSISTVGEALVALEKEINALEEEEQRLIAKRRLVRGKLASCHGAIRDLLLKAGGKYEARVWPKFPELN